MPRSAAGAVDSPRRDRSAAIEDDRRRRDGEAERRREEARALDAEGGHEQKRRRQRADDRAGGVGRVEDARGRRDGVGVWTQRPQQGRQRAAHQEGRHAHQAERKRPGERTDASWSATKSGAERASASVERTPSTATPASSHAYSLTGRATRSARRPSEAPPSASPAKKALSAIETAWTSTPTTRPSCLHPERLVDERDRAGHEEQCRDGRA